MVLFLNRIAYIDEFAVLEDEEVVICSKDFETGDGFIAEVGNDVDVRFEGGDMGTKLYYFISKQLVSAGKSFDSGRTYCQLGRVALWWW